MSVYHDDTHHGAFKDLLDYSGAPTISSDEYKIEVLDIALSSRGTPAWPLPESRHPKSW